MRHNSRRHQSGRPRVTVPLPLAYPGLQSSATVGGGSFRSSRRRAPLRRASRLRFGRPFLTPVQPDTRPSPDRLETRPLASSQLSDDGFHPSLLSYGMVQRQLMSAPICTTIAMDDRRFREAARALETQPPASDNVNGVHPPTVCPPISVAGAFPLPITRASPAVCRPPTAGRSATAK